MHINSNPSYNHRPYTNRLDLMYRVAVVVIGRTYYNGVKYNHNVIPS